MSDTTIDISLAASNRAEVETAMKRLRSAGLDIEWRRIIEARVQGFRAPEGHPSHVDGKLRLYDTPETVEAKARAVRGAVGRFLNGRIVP